MKQILMLYVGMLLLSAFIGGVVSIAYHYSWYILLLLIIPILFGCACIYSINLRINEKNLKNVTILTAVSFLIMLGLLAIAAYYHIDERSFWGLIYAGGVSSFIFGLAIIALKLPNKWEEKRKIEKKFPYWELKSAPYWCRFFD